MSAPATTELAGERLASNATARRIAVLVVASAAFGAALYTRRTGNVWLGVGIASAIALGVAWMTGVLPRARYEGRGWLVELGLGVVLGVAMALATHALAPVGLGLVPGAYPEVRALYANLQHPPGPVLALPVLAFAVVAEEVIWRGVAMEALDVRRRPMMAVAGAAVLYALPQVASGSWLLFVLALVCGLAWGALRVWRKGLLAPMLTHFVWNLIVFVFWPLHAAAETPL